MARLRPRFADFAFLLIALWFTLAQFGSEGFGEYERVATDPDWLGALIIVAEVLPLLWRRRAPFAVFLATLPSAIALLALGYAVQTHLAPAFALYTFLAAQERGNVRLVLAVAVAALTALEVVAATQLSLSPEEYILPVAVWAGACLVGDRRRTTAQQLEREQQLAVAEERARIARELHDSAGHAINTIRVHAGAARVLRERDPERSREAIEIIEQVARETAEDIDRIVGALRGDEPATLTPAPGLDQIADLVARSEDATLRDSGEAGVPLIVSRAAYRIAQETLTNAAKHGDGGVELAIERGEEALVITVVNDVAGEPAGRVGGGRGIPGMRERTALLGGSLEAGRTGARFRVRAVLPYSRTE